MRSAGLPASLRQRRLTEDLQRRFSRVGAAIAIVGFGAAAVLCATARHVATRG